MKSRSTMKPENTITSPRKAKKMERGAAISMEVTARKMADAAESTL